MHPVRGALSQVPVVKDRGEGENSYWVSLIQHLTPPEGGVVAKIRLVLADANQQMTSMVRQTLGEEPEAFEVVGTAENGKQAIEAVLSLNPDALVIDMWMPILNGLQAAKHFSQLIAQPRSYF
jgi:CheY-like chemotaxis protein